MNETPSLDVLIFAPHPDDAELGMGGTIVKLIESGKRVGVVDLCRGELGTKGDVETRARETAESTKILGLHYRGNLDLGDGCIFDNQENRRKAAEEIRRWQSPYVFVCSPYDPHPDHRAGSELIQAAFFLARLPKVKTESAAFSPRRCLYYFLHEMRDIAFVVDITSQFDRKLEALKAFRSQFVEPNLPPDYQYLGTSDYLRQIEAYNRALGARAGAIYAEGYRSDRLISLSIPTIIE